MALPESIWRAALRALPMCQACGSAAEVIHRHGGLRQLLCVGCAAHERRGRIEALDHADAVSGIETALLERAGIL